MDSRVPPCKSEGHQNEPGTSRPGVVAAESLCESENSSSHVHVNSGAAITTRGKRTTIYIQDECFKHRFVRSRDVSGIVERPERLHAVKLGFAAAISRIEEVEAATTPKEGEADRAAVQGEVTSTASGADELAAALERLEITPTPPSQVLRTSSISIRRTSATVELLNNQAVKYVHGDIDGDVYLENLIAWARESQENITKKGSEIPEGIPPLDLYLCPESIDAIQGAIGAVCEAVDAVIAATQISPFVGSYDSEPCERAFVTVRPPGHHCGEDTPSGFCFVNNVAIGAAHAHLNHGIQRIVILDIDLHHGNGTQSIVWQINEETYRETLESELSSVDDQPPKKPGPRIFYGSLHDILSFPCEDGKPDMVQAASTSIHGPHGQYIENIHLQRYNSEAHFWDVLYPQHYLNLLHRAQAFLDQTGGPGDDVLIFISCGFDACEHEYPSMSRHNRKVPVGFYHKFTRETCRMADIYAQGRVVSVLEGGYSDRALTSGAMAHLCGLVDKSPSTQAGPPRSEEWVNESWWEEANLVKLEKAAKSRKSAPRMSGVGISTDAWLTRAVELLPLLGADSKPSSSRGTTTSPWVPPTSMTLRERKKPANDAGIGKGTPPESEKRKNGGRSASGKQAAVKNASPSVDVSPSPAPGQEEGARTEKKLPRVILRVRPPADMTG